MDIPLRTNTKISGPILQPDNEISSFNGFAWTDRGLVHQSSVFTSTKTGDYAQWLGTQP